MSNDRKQLSGDDYDFGDEFHRKHRLKIEVLQPYILLGEFLMYSIYIICCKYILNRAVGKRTGFLFLDKLL